MAGAYPIQTLSDGRVKYSDGSIRGTAKNRLPSGGQTVAQKLFQQGAQTLSKPNLFGQPVTRLANGQTFVTPSSTVMNSPAGSYTPPSNSNNPADQPRKSFADILTDNSYLFSSPNKSNLLKMDSLNPSDTNVGSAKLKTDFDIVNNPQFLNFSELWKNITNAHNQGSWGNAGGDKWYNKDYGITEFLKPKIAYAAESNNEPTTTNQDGIVTSPELNKLKNGASNLAVGSDVYPIQTLADGRVRYSDGSIRDGSSGTSFADKLSQFRATPEYKLGNAEKTAKDLLTDVNAKNGDGSGLYTIIDPNMEQLIKENAQRIYDNGASEEEVANYIKKAAEDALDVEYERLNTEADLNIPKYQRYATEAIDEVNQNQKDLEELGAKSKTEANNTYAEKLLQSQLSQRADDTKLRNLFSNLGTAESSAFIENMTKNASDYGKYNTQLNVANIKSIGDIDSEILKGKNAATKQINSITKDRDEKILAVEKNKELYPKEKYAEKQKILAEYKVNLQSIYQDVSDKITQLQNLKLEYLMGQSNINQNAKISSDLLNQEYALQQKTSNTMANVIPTDLDSELTQFSLRPTSSLANNKKRDELAFLYPQFAEMINNVYNGSMTYQTAKKIYGLS